MKKPEFLADNIPHRIFIKDRSFAYTFCNRLYAQDYGLEPEEIIGKDDFAIHPRGIAEEYRVQDEEILTLGEQKQFIEKYYPLGKERWVRTTKVPYRDSNGRIVGVLGFFDDITELKKNEAVVREQAEQFNVFKESTRDGFLLVGEDAKLVDCNEAAARMLGYSVEELRDMHIMDIEAAESKEDTAVHIQRMMETGSDIFQSRHRKKNGDIIDVEVSVSFWRARNQFFSFVRDITTRKKEERELEQLRKNLASLVDQRTEELEIALKAAENANKAKSRFLSRMSHELRTPLNAIIGFSQLMETDDESALSAEQKDNVQEILKAGNHLLKLIDTMLEFSAVNENLLNLQIEKIDCGPVISECLETMGPAAATRNISLDAAIKKSCIIQADKNRFRQVLLSLISNAIKYNRDNGSVTVSCKSTEGYVRITVTDTGRGIEPEYQNTVFEPFEGTGTRYSVTSGIGIGLAMAKQLVEEMKGNIGVESRIGEGSSFWFELPYEAG